MESLSIEGSQVPQATLKNVRRVVEAVRRGAKTPQMIASRTKLSDRHVGYAAAAGRSLGLLELGADGHQFELTATGMRFAESSAHSEDERRTIVEAGNKSPILQRIAPGLFGVRAPTRSELVEHVMRATQLSRGTAEHRAAMMLQWRRDLLNFRMPILLKRGGMWRRIDIANFRSIEHANVDLAPFTLVVGPNGSGKSNFADALVFARDVAFDAAGAVSSRGGIAGVRRWRPSKPTDVSIDVRSSSSRASLERAFARHSFKMHSGKKGNWSFSKESIEVFEKGDKRAFVERDRATVNGDPITVPLPNETASVMLSARQFPPFSAATSPLRNVRRYRLNPDSMRQPQLSSQETRLAETGENIAAAIQSITAAQGMPDVLQPMAKIVPGLRNIFVEQVGRFLALKFEQMQEEGVFAEFNATEMSEGALRALGIIVATHQMEKDELLIIEEPEVSIHVGAATLLFELLKEASGRGAVLVTTHSADLLDAARDEEILVCKYRQGKTIIGPLAKAQKDLVREGLFSVSEMMRSEPLRIEGESAEGVVVEESR